MLQFYYSDGLWVQFSITATYPLIKLTWTTLKNYANLETRTMELSRTLKSLNEQSQLSLNYVDQDQFQFSLFIFNLLGRRHLGKYSNVDTRNFSELFEQQDTQTFV